MGQAPINAQLGRPRGLAGLRAALLEDFEPDILVALRVAVMLAAGFRHPEIARRLEVSAPALRVAEARVKLAAKRLDVGDDARGPRAG